MVKMRNAFLDLTTPRLRLREFRASDAADMGTCFGDAMQSWCLRVGFIFDPSEGLLPDAKASS